MASTDRIPYSLAARELLRNTLLDAACHELEDRLWAEITMADIARAAGVSRQTLYKEFGSRDEFAQTLVLREADRLLSAVQDAVLANVEDATRAISAAFEVFLAHAADNSLVRTIVRGDGSEGLLALVTTQGEPLVTTAAKRLMEMILAGWPGVRNADAELLSEGLVRLAISYAALPSGSSSRTAAGIARLLGPFVEQLFSEARARNS